MTKLVSLLKSFLKRILPLPARHAVWQYEMLAEKLEHLDKLNKIDRLEASIVGVSAQIGHLSRLAQENNEIIAELEAVIQSIHTTGIDAIQTKFSKQAETLLQMSLKLNNIEPFLVPIKNTVDYNKTLLGAIQNTSQEVLWANIFNSTVTDSKWLNYKTLSPGRWAAGYPFLYILYRVLRDTKPKRILELGLGETTKLISQYAAETDTEHWVVDHDEIWIEFFKNDFALPPNTKLVNLPWAFEPYKNDTVRTYAGFAETFKNGRYGLICIDGPLGGDMKTYSRIDTLQLLPEHLDDSFVILVDDYNRQSERNTVSDMLEILDQNNIEYSKGVYKGDKEVFLICSTDYKFLVTL